MSAIGRPLRRLEDGRFLEGRGRYTDGLAPADALHAIFLRSPHAHARVRATNATAALSLPGVAAILTGADVAADGLGHLPAACEIFDAGGRRHREPTRLPIDRDRVRHVGEIVAMVVADTPGTARDAAERIEVAYESLPAVVSAAAALRPEAPILHDDAPGNLMCLWERGDVAAVEAAFARAARVVSLRQRFNRIAANYLEPRALWAAHDAGTGVTTLACASQGAHIIHRLLCERVLRWDPASLRVVTPDVGGGFGPKFSLYPETALVPWAARRLGRPVRWACERGEHFLADNHARDLEAEIALALDQEGRFLAVRVDATAGFGAYVSMFAPIIPTTGMARVLSGLYRIPAMRIDMRCAFSNTVPVDAFRGAGKPEALALLERVIDLAADDLGVGPVDLRRRNLLRPGDFPYASPLGYSYEAGEDYGALLDSALELADAAGLPERRLGSAARGRSRGFGVACHLHVTGGIADERARVTLLRDGTVEALAGTQSQGQGHETAFAQVVADALRVPPERVRVVQGDTARVACGGGTGGSSSLIVGGTTLQAAALRVVERARVAAADRLEAAPADLALVEGGAFEVVGTDRRVSLAELARDGEDGRLAAESPFDGTVETWPVGVMTCEVEVDPETGQVAVERLDVAIDVGRVVNPLLVEGQIHGGIAAGLGQALLEDACYDDAGQLLAGSLMDYALPRAEDVPPMRVRTAEAPSSRNALGVKGVGELPTNGAPAAVANAVLDALSPWGVRHLPTPLTPERVWRAIRGRT